MSTKVMLAIIAMISTAMAQTNFTENSVTVPSGKSLDMIFVEGGTFQMGCSGRSNPSCGANETPVHSVTLSDYYIGKYEVTRGQWKAVMGSIPPPMFEGLVVSDDVPINSIDWYAANEFVCELGKKTGKKYRLATEAEWEFAARGGKKTQNTGYSGSANADAVAWHQGSTFPPTQICMDFNGRPFCSEINMGGAAQPVGQKAANELGTYDMSGNVREWTYDSFAQSYSSGAVTNPTGPVALHSQKIRRGGGYMTPSSQSTVTGRLIRSIEGADGDLGFRLAISKDQNTIPTGMVAACDIHKPPVSNGKGTLRDDRLITKDGEVWANGSTVLIVKENGAAVMKPSYGSTHSGEWATANDFSLYITNSSGTRKKWIYYIVSEYDMTLMEDNGMPGRWERRPASEVSGASNIAVPTPTGKSPEELIPAGAAVNMNNPPTTGKDSRLIVAQTLGTGNGWLQDNVALNAGGTHRYRFDYTADTARFVVWDVMMNSSVIISTGKWFTIDNTFLRIIGDNGRRYDYLYTVTTNGNTHYHISYQGYERGDFRMFEKKSVEHINDVAQWKEPTMSPYATNGNGGSTYLPPDSVELAQVVVSSSSARSSSSREGSSSSSKESSSSSSRESSSSSAETTSLLPQIAMNNQAVQVKNGVNLQVVKEATLEIYNIRGNLVNRQNYASGVHSVSFTHLPKGIYVVKVRFGSDVKILRMPVM
ncbi:MAG: SUMF1/EgtB/PvdO family nonheme iron enzyme [Candidatus Fibromonas sp.]|jgi:formylglycine-generating enzyme required for sulfatase activity|nr:SUMF1/EgtB/PvdO family nonheme iron enzyme [Candidatus Fibromonas sp.]